MVYNPFLELISIASKHISHCLGSLWLWNFFVNISVSSTAKGLLGWGGGGGVILSVRSFLACLNGKNSFDRNYIENVVILSLTSLSASTIIYSETPM